MKPTIHVGPQSGRLAKILSTLCLAGAIALTGVPAAVGAATYTVRSETITNTMANLKNSEQRWLEIDLSRQRLFAWEGDKQVYAVVISTGKAATPTPTGVFAIQTRYRTARMQGADYDIPDVPYTMYFYRGYAIHGAYWHNRFGTPVSHGCVNVAVDHARWFFNWARIGMPVVVHH